MPLLPTYNFNIMTYKILLKKSQLSTFIDLHSKQKSIERERAGEGTEGRLTKRTQMVNKLERDPDSIYAPFCRSSLSLFSACFRNAGKMHENNYDKNV